MLSGKTSARGKTFKDTIMIDEQVADSSASAGGQQPQRGRRIQDAVIRLAGNSQDGIQAIGGFLARLAGRTDKDVMTYMTIPATISGGPSIYQVRLGTGEVLSAGDDVDILVAFYQHSYKDHIGTLRDGGILIYDADNVQPDPNEKRFRADRAERCQRRKSESRHRA